jgi:hypothetical protein
MTRASSQDALLLDDSERLGTCAAVVGGPVRPALQQPRRPAGAAVAAAGHGGNG